MPKKHDLFDEEQETSARDIGVETGVFGKCGRCGDMFVKEPNPCAIKNLVEESLGYDEDVDEIHLGSFNTLSELLFVINTLHGRLKQQHRCG